MPRKSAFAMLRERERVRRLVPPVVIKRRVTLRQGVMEDPAVPVLMRSKRLARKHSVHIYDLVIRSMGLLQTPDMIKAKFRRDGLDNIGMDDSAKALVQNAVRKISEVLIFRMVANELVNDPVMRERIVTLFVDHRFEAMSRPGPSPAAPASSAPPAVPRPGVIDPSVPRELVEQMLAHAMGL